MPPSVQTRKIQIVVDAAGAKDALDSLSSSMGRVNKNTQKMAEDMGFLSNAVKGWLAYMSVTQVIRMSDEMQNLANRAKALTTDGTAVADVLKEIIEVSKRTYQQVSDVGHVFTTLQASLKGTGTTTKEMVAITESLIASFRLSGSSTSQITGAMTQLSHAFTTNQVHMRDLRLLMQDNVILGDAMRRKFGVDIFKESRQGMISSSAVLRALAENLQEVMLGANQMTPTFEQSANILKDQMYQSIYKLNEELGVSSGFFKIIAFVANNFNLVLIGLVPTIIAATVSTLGLKKAFDALMSSTFVGLIAVMSGFIVKMIGDMGGLENLMIGFRFTLADTEIGILKIARAWADWRGNTDRVKELDAEINSLVALKNALKDQYDQNKLAKEATELHALSIEEITDLAKKYKIQLEEAARKIDNSRKASLDAHQELAKLNKEYKDGLINIDQYARKLSEFGNVKKNIELKEGKKNIFDAFDQADKSRIEGFNRGVAQAGITMDSFNKSVANLQSRRLDRDFKAGRISIDQYNEGLTKLNDGSVHLGAAMFTGTKKYLESIGTLSSGIAGGITQAFSHVEDAFVEFTKTGKFNFKSFAQSILDDLNKIIIRAMIIKPFADAILTGLSGPGGAAIPAGGQGGGNTLLPNAKGNAFDSGNIRRFATGGIVSSPTMFGFGKGKTGVMGEAGTEAILPLSRGSGGDLGVKASVTPVTVNIINQNGSDVTTQETSGPNGQRTIEIMIRQKVREGIANGSYDRVMANSYGVSRKGS